MPLEIRSATSPEELQELYRLRYQVFVEEWDYYPENSQKLITDEYDDLATTRNFLAFIDNRIVGGVRVVAVQGQHTAIDDFFAYDSYLPRDGSRAAVVGMFFVIPEQRRRGGPASPLLTLVRDYAMHDETPYLIAAVSPEAEKIVQRHGYHFLAPRFFHEDKELWVAPMMLDLSAEVFQSHRVPHRASRSKSHIGTNHRRPDNFAQRTSAPSPLATRPLDRKPFDRKPFDRKPFDRGLLKHGAGGTRV